MQNSKAGRQTISQETVRRQVLVLMSVVLFLALSMVSSTTVNAQIECLNVCEQQYAACVNGGNNQAFAASCLDTYEACVDACLGSSAALLG
jgi:hypothetical protein